MDQNIPMKQPLSVQAMIESIEWYKVTDPMRDPFFGYPLWFVGNIHGCPFRVYNREQLAFLKSFISATLRVRTPNKNRSFISRLPAWLVSKKNRSAVLKAISRMERRFSG